MSISPLAGASIICAGVHLALLGLPLMLHALLNGPNKSS